MELKIREIDSASLDKIVDLHMRVLHEEFITKLGKRFMRTYYLAFAESPYAVALMAEDGTNPVGALLGTLNPTRHYPWVVRNFGFRLFVDAIAEFLKQRAVAREFLRTRLVRYSTWFWRKVKNKLRTASRPSMETASAERTLQVADITHLWVYQSKHRIGTSLVMKYESIARASGVTCVDLVTLPDELGGAAPFYRKLGFQELGIRISRSGERFVLCRKILTSETRKTDDCPTHTFAH